MSNIILDDCASGSVFIDECLIENLIKCDDMGLVQEGRAGNEQFPIKGHGTYRGFAGVELPVYWCPHAKLNILSQVEVVDALTRSGYACLSMLEQSKTVLVSPDGCKYGFEGESGQMIFTGSEMLVVDDPDVSAYLNEVEQQLQRLNEHASRARVSRPMRTERLQVDAQDKISVMATYTRGYQEAGLNVYGYFVPHNRIPRYA